MIAMGGMAMIMFICRFVFFTLYESPKYLMGKGKDEQAVKIVHEVARRNGKTSNLTLADLQAFDGDGHQRTEAAAILARRLEKLNFTHVRSLFATKKLAYSTSLITLLWAFIGLGFPLYNAYLPFIQAQKGAEFGDASIEIVYRNLLIIAVLGIPGALLGGVLVEIPRFGRKGALAISTTLTGVFLFASTTALTSNALLGWNCAFSFMSNVMYAVLYAYTPEGLIFSCCFHPNTPANSKNSLSHQRSRHWERDHGMCQPSFRHHGSHHRHVRQSRDLGACLCERRSFPYRRHLGYDSTL